MGGFLGRFFGYFTLLYSAYSLLGFWITDYHALLATLVDLMLSPFWPALSSHGVYLHHHGAPILWIVASCDGLAVALPVAAAVLANRLSWRSRALGLLWLLPLLWGLNFGRLLALTGIRLTADLFWFDLIHVYAFQPLMALLAIGLYGVWRAYHLPAAASAA